MMGYNGGDQNRLFYSFNLDDHVPASHLLRGINQFLDLSDLRAYLAPFYSHTGRPSIDPELMIRVLIVGYCLGIRSERRLCEEVHLNLAYRWFCGLGLEDAVPEHSTFSKNRHGRFRESEAFRHVFETVLERCMSEGLVGGDGFAIDASVVKADAARASAIPGAAIDYRALGPAQASRAVREYLEGLDADGRPETMRKSISVTDPAPEWTCAPGGPAFFAYSTNYLLNVRAGVIVDVEATNAHKIKEVDATRTMIDRAEHRFALKPTRLIGDMAYGAADLLAWMVNDKAIEPHVPLWDKTQRTHITKADTINYTSSQSDCVRCPIKARCCPNTPMRRIQHSIHEPARDVARAVARTRLYKQSRKDRKKVEMLFAHLKRIIKLDRLRLRGPSGAHDEFLLAATAQNLRRMAKRLCPSPPRPAFGTA